ncbi:hypothetical protein LEMLEM_LOCUS8491 [Lemmus lemmus]
MLVLAGHAPRPRPRSQPTPLPSGAQSSWSSAHAPVPARFCPPGAPPMLATPPPARLKMSQLTALVTQVRRPWASSQRLRTSGVHLQG